MHPIRVTAIVLAGLLALVSCSRDPNVAKRRYLDSGNKYFEKGKYKEASIMYRNALQKDLRYGPAHYKLGLSYAKLGQYAPAVQSLRRAVELLPAEQPDRSDAMVRLSDIYLAATHEKQFLDEVEGYTKELLKRDPNSFDGHRLLADLNYVRATEALRVAQRDAAKTYLDQAVVEYRKADTIQAGQQGVSMQLARALWAKGDAAGAEQYYRGVIERDKTFEAGYTELYRLYMVMGKPQQAEQVLRQGFQNNSKKYEFLILLASHYYGQRRPEDMGKVLQEIKGHARDFDRAYLTVGDFYAQMGKGDDAIREYREGMGNDTKKKAEYQKRIIAVLLNQGKRDAAAGVNAEILKDNSNDVDAKGLAASFLLDKGDVNKAFTEMQAIVAKAPDSPVAHYNMGRAHEARAEWEQARQEFQKSLELRADYTAPQLALAQLQLRLREFDAAVKSAERLRSMDGGNMKAALVESAALLGQGKTTASRALLDQLLNLYPNSPEVWMQMGVIHASEKKYKDAEDAFRRVYQLTPGSMQGLMGLVDTYMAESKGDQALQLLESEAAKQPKRLDIRVALGNAEVLTGKFDKAIADYQAGVALLDPQSNARGDLYLRLGETYRWKGDFGKAISYLQQARTLLPDNAAVLSTLARVLDGAGRKPEAREVYQAILKSNPNDPVALNNLAFLLADDGKDLDQALTLAQRAKQLLPNLPEVSDTLGWIYLKKNLSDNAVDIFQQLVSKQPNQATFRYHLGLALSQKGDKPRAAKELEQALKDNPPKEEKDKIRQVMSSL